MNGTVTASKPQDTLPDAAIKEIVKILRKGRNAKVATSKGGVTVYEEKVEIKYSQS